MNDYQRHLRETYETAYMQRRHEQSDVFGKSQHVLDNAIVRQRVTETSTYTSIIWLATMRHILVWIMIVSAVVWFLLLLVSSIEPRHFRRPLRWYLIIPQVWEFAEHIFTVLAVSVVYLGLGILFIPTLVMGHLLRIVFGTTHALMDLQARISSAAESCYEFICKTIERLHNRIHHAYYSETAFIATQKADMALTFLLGLARNTLIASCVALIVYRGLGLDKPATIYVYQHNPIEPPAWALAAQAKNVPHEGSSSHYQRGIFDVESSLDQKPVVSPESLSVQQTTVTQTLAQTLTHTLTHTVTTTEVVAGDPEVIKTTEHDTVISRELDTVTTTTIVAKEPEVITTTVLVSSDPETSTAKQAGPGDLEALTIAPFIGQRKIYPVEGDGKVYCRYCRQWHCCEVRYY